MNRARTDRRPDRAPDLRRRRILAFGALLVGDRVLVACGGASGAFGGGDGGTADGSASGLDAASGDATSSCLSGDASSADASAWATGGTASMTGKGSYPNPFAAGCNTPTTCTVTCELTQGPCYSSQSVEMQDISYGYTGLPMRMMFQVLDESCNPVSGAVIDVWHVSPAGKYSGDDTANEDIAFCTGNDSDFTSHLYFRGKQTTDALGIATFDSCFPGWYSSRTVHVHLTIAVGTQAYVTTQLAFDDALDDEIIASQPVYEDRGARDTKNTTDTVFSPGDYQDYLFATQRMTDGAMLAWKTIVLRSSTTESLCGGGAVEGGAMGPSDGMGPPGDGSFGPPPGDGAAPPNDD
jgi:protocatechuate 3,4-dioxygenase beta subunit